MAKRVIIDQRGKHVGKTRLNTTWSDLHVEWFEQCTHIFSGQTSDTRNLTIPHHVLHCRLHAHTPAMLRELVARDPALVLEAEAHHAQGKPLTKLQSDVLWAIYAARQPNFDPIVEYDLRYRAHELAYHKKLAVAREAAAHLTKEVAEDAFPLEMETFDDEKTDDEPLVPPQLVRVFDPKSHVCTMVTPRTFYNILEAAKVKFTTCCNETRCPLHDEGPIKQLQLAAVIDIDLRIAANEADREALRHEYVELD
jgi:hypothetical protein